MFLFSSWWVPFVNLIFLVNGYFVFLFEILSFVSSVLCIFFVSVFVHSSV